MSRTLTRLRRSTRSIVVVTTALSAMAASALAYADGIDLSHWQGTVAWSRVKADGVTFAFMKATEGSYYTDPTLKTNWAGAQKQGIYRGAYHFARPSVGSAAAQARYFVGKVGSFKGAGVLPPVLDLEATGGLSGSQLKSWVATWLQTTEQLTGRTPMVYVSPYFWIDHVQNSAAFTHYPLWIAHYTTGSPKVPGGWPTWTFWQRTSKGSVSGIGGTVDMNRFNGSSAQLAKIANATGGSTNPPPTGPTLPTGAATTIGATASTVTPTIGQKVPFTGDLRTASPVNGVAGRTVSLWSRAVGATTWNRVTRGTTSSTGHYSLSAVVNQSADYQLRWVGDASYAAAVSRVLRLTAARRVVALDLHKNKTTVARGAALTLYGHTTARVTGTGLAGLTVRYYKRMPNGGAWQYVGMSTSVAPTGWHSIVVHPQIARVWKAVYSGSTTNAPVTSTFLTVRPQ